MFHIATGCGSAWLERHVRDVEAVGSNPTSPIGLEDAQDR